MSLTSIDIVQVLDLSNNRLSGPVPDNGSFSLFTSIRTTIFATASICSTTSLIPRDIHYPIGGCGAKLKYLGGFEYHYLARHTASCSACSRVYPTSRLLSIHISEAHDPFFRAKVARVLPMEVILAWGLLLVGRLLVLLYFLLLLQFVLLGGVDANYKNISLIYQLKRTLKLILAEHKRFSLVNYKLQLILLAKKTFWEDVVLARCTRDVLPMVHWLQLKD